MADVGDSDNRQLELLEELVAWTRFANRDAVIKVISSVMQEVGAFASLSQPAVSGLWSRWRRLGLVTDQSGRMQHLVRPSDLGLQIPEAGGVASDAKPGERAEG